MGGCGDEVFYMLLWMLDRLSRPCMSRVGESFETWAWRNGCLREIHELERRHFLRESGPCREAPHLELTRAGQRALYGGRIPESRWRRPWDGTWRLVCFDLPSRDEHRRKTLRRFFQAHHFGRLQRSVWITPDPLEPVMPALRQLEPCATRLTMLGAVVLDGQPSGDVVSASWDFAAINEAYRTYLAVLREGAEWLEGSLQNAALLQLWSSREIDAWQTAVRLDPLLPRSLWPSGYLGHQAWAERCRVLDQLGHRWMLRFLEVPGLVR